MEMKIKTKNKQPCVPGMKVKNIYTHTGKGAEETAGICYSADNGKEEKQGIPYLAFQGLEDTGVVKHLFSTRLGGVSEGEFSGMNLSFTRGDKEECVKENYRRIANILDCKPEDMVATYQTHTKNLRVITKEDAGHGVTREKYFFDVDGLLTNEPGIMLVAYFADCVPIYLVDPVRKAVALCHSGWKGTAMGIGAEAVIKMQEEFGSAPSDIRAAIGPSICKDCYEVSEDLLLEFQEKFWPIYGSQEAVLVKKANPAMSNVLFEKKENGKYQLDLWLANQLVLKKVGIREEHLEVTNICTCCNPDILFSHRASKGKRGNLCAFLGLK